MDAFGVLIVARGLEELLEAAVMRVNCKRAAMLRESIFRERMMQHPATLQMEEKQMKMIISSINSGSVLL